MSCDNFKPINEPTGSNGGSSTAWEDITHKPTAFPSIWSLIGDKPNFFSGSFNDLSDLPTFFSGSWNDLSDRPMAYPPAGHDHTVTDITDFPPLFSGSWNDLSNKPDLSSLHSHSNKSILDSIINTGDGSQFLANNGTYKSIGGETVNIETLTANKTLTASDATVQILTSSANRDVVLPTTGISTGHKFVIWNNNAYTSGISLNVKQSTILIDMIYPQKITVFYWNNSNWIIADSSNIIIGKNALANNGIAIGSGAQAVNLSTSIGLNAITFSQAIAIGAIAHGGDGGVSIGYSSMASDFNVAVGYDADVKYKGVNTCVYGAYSTAERNREFVSTATANTINKAQMTIQKYVEKDLNSNSSAFQELFIDGSSARLTIIASSVYQFRIQLNAINKTNFDVKTWEITGAIKRNASNVTSLVGTPTKTVTAQDAGASEWDVQVTADDTNEALKIEVKHTSANQVRFSLNIWATETRI